MIAGIVAACLAALLGLIFFILAVAAANPCGMFADGCDDHGKTPTGAVVFGALTMLMGAIAVAGVVMAVVSAQRR